MSSMRGVQTAVGRVLRPTRVCAFAAALVLVSCYTVRVAEKTERLSATESASKVLHETIFEYTQETLYTFPNLATRAGVHRHKLPNGEIVRLDRELPNFSEDVVAARTDAIKAYLERLDRKARVQALSPNDRADRRLVVDAMKAELALWEDRQEHTSNPLFHATALAESLYYPLVVDYAPERDRLDDVVARLQWVPSFVDRAMRMTKAGSEAQFQAAAAVNRFSTAIVEKELGARIGEDAALKQSYEGMKGSVINSLAKMQGFLDGGAKDRRTFRFGADRYREHVALLWHGAVDPAAMGEVAKKRVEDLKREMYVLAKPAYCEANETDRKTCGPTKADIAAAKKAEEDKVRKEEAAAKKAQEKQQREEAAAAKKAEAEEQREEAAAAKKAEEEKAKAKAEKAKGEKEITNPYESKPKPAPEKKTKGVLENPYGALVRPVPTALGAKQADAPTAKEKAVAKEKAPAKEKAVAKEKAPATVKGAAVEEKGAAAEEKGAPAEKKDAVEEKETPPSMGGADHADDGATMDKVIGFVLGQIAAQKPAGPGPGDRLLRAIERTRERAAKIGFLEPSTSSVAVTPMPAMMAAMHRIFTLSPVPPFEPKEGARLFVSVDAPTAQLTDLSSEWMEAAAAEWASPGMSEVFAHAGKIEPQTRRAARAIFGDAAFVEGFGLYAAIAIVRDSSDEAWRTQLVAMAVELRAAVEALVDVGLHTEGMSEADALALLKRDAYCDQAYADNQIAFAKLYPGALATPFVGLERWRAMRSEIAAAEKDGFDEKAFHADALAVGPVAFDDLAAILKGNADAPPDFDDGEPSTSAVKEPKFTFMGTE